jgi:type I restriction enzyme S subunit
MCLTEVPALTNQQINSIVVDKEHYEAAFVYYRLLSIRDEIKARAGGAATPIINKSVFEGIPVSVPPLLNQRKIAAILSAYDDLIENNNRRIKLLEEMAQRTYREWFVDFRFPGHEAVPLVESQLGLIPEGWEIGELDDLVVLQRGFDLPTTRRENGDVPVVSAAGKSGTHNVAKVSGPGVVTGRSGSLGTVQYIVEDFWPLNTTLWAKEYGRASPEFVFFLLRQLDLSTFNSGVAVPTLNRNDISTMREVLPPSSLIERFSSGTRDVLDVIRVFEKSSEVLSASRELLLPPLISGEIDVTDLSIAWPEEAA